MALIVADRIQETTNSTGTGAYTLGGVVAGFRTFASVASNTDTVYYSITDNVNFEVGLGTYASSGGTITRTSVFTSSNSNNAVNWGVGTKNIFLTYPADKAVIEDASNNVTIGNNLIVGGTVDGVDIQTLLSRGGGTMTGNLILNANPTAALQSATKQYVDTIAAAGIHYHEPCRVETTANLNATYSNGSSGVGATLTNAATQAALVLDGVSVTTNNRVMVQDQTNKAHNGVYKVTTVGSGSANWVLTRATDADSYAPSDSDALGEGDAFFITEGTVHGGELDVMTTTGVITFGTTNIVFTLVADAPIYSAGAGLSLSGTQFSLNTPVSTATALATGRVISLTGDATGSSGSFNGTANTSINTTVAGLVGKQPYLTIAVTVSNPGAGNRFYLDGALQQTALLQRSVTVRFDQSNSSNSGHPLRLSVTSNGTHAGGSAYTVGVTAVGTPGSSGAYTQVTLEQDAPINLFYYCTNHSGMGGKVSTGIDLTTTATPTFASVTADLTGSATTLANGRTIGMTGDVVWTSAAFNGSGNVTGTATIQANSVALGTDTTGNYVQSVANGSYLTGGGSASEGTALTLGVDAVSGNTASKVVARDGSGNFSAGTITAALTGNASTATTLATARTINGVAFNGSANITIGSGIVATGALNSGSITSGFGNINNGSSTITTGAITAGGNLTRGGTVILDGSITDTGDFTLDVAGEIILDADTQGSGNGVILKDAGTAYGSFFRSSSNFHIKSEASDQDMIFIGNDGGTEITALTLDMSNKGSATFNTDASITAQGTNNEGGGQLFLKGTDSPAASKNLGQISFGNSDDNSLAMIRGVSTAATAADLVFFTEATGAAIEEHMRIKDNGKVGIGTNGPNRKLHVSQGGTLSTGNDYDVAIFQNSDAAGIRLVDAGNGGSNGGNAGLGNDNGNLNVASAGVMSFSTSLAANAPLYGGSNSGGTERIRIDTSGNVTVGTTSTSSKLEVNGDIGIGRVAGGYTFREVVGGGERAGINSDANNHLIFNTSNASEKMRINDSGNVLVGKTSTAQQTAGTVLYGSGQIYATATSTHPLVITRKQNDGAHAIFYSDTNEVGQIGNSGSGLSISSGGNLTLDSAADIILDADGAEIFFADGGTNFVKIQNDGGNAQIRSLVSDKDIQFIGNDGGSAITALTLDMSGAGAATFNNDVTAFSDERLKSNIITIPDALSKVSEMRGVHYVRDATGKDSTGVIAQEMQKVAPELVLTAEDEMGTLSVNYGNITGYLIEAIKELKAEIEDLKAR